MANRFVEMWRRQGTIDRKTYAVAGCSAFILKYFLDKFVAFAVFGQPWLLTALPEGRTRLEGATWYQHTMWPAAYWHLWSDYIIHKIHLRVLEHIRAEAERN